MKHPVIILLMCLLLLGSCRTQKQPSNISSEEESMSAVVTYSEESTCVSAEQSQTEEPNTDLRQFVSETVEDEKKAVAIFDQATISDIRHDKDSGTVYTLSSSEINGIIESMISYFQTHDLIRIIDINGNTNTYRGLPFYQSDEYFACFGVLNPSTEASFDYKKDLLSAVFQCVEVLHTNIFDGFESDSKYVLVTSQNMSTDNSSDFFNALYNVYELGSTAPDIKNILAEYPLSAFYFDFNNKGIGYIPDISVADPSKMEQLLSDGVLPSQVSPTKFDYNGKVVVIELYENATQKLIARLRFDEMQNADVISDIQARFDQFTAHFSGSGNAEQSTKYRAVVYLNGFSFASSNDTCIQYCPDGDLNLSNFSGGYNLFQHNIFFQKGCQPLTEYINDLLQTNLTE